MLSRSEGLSYISSAVFIARMQWVVAGDSHANIIVWTTCNAKFEKLKKFKANTNYTPIELLAVHPTLPYVLSSHGRYIKLWSWDVDIGKDWDCIREFKKQSGIVDCLAFNHTNAQQFALLIDDKKKIMIYSIDSEVPLASVDLPAVHTWYTSISYYPTESELQYMMVIGRSIQILDLQAKRNVHEFQGIHGFVYACAIHPKLPIIATGTDKGEVLMWNYITYSLMQELSFGQGSKVKFLGFMDLEGCKRLVIGFEENIEMVDIIWT